MSDDADRIPIVEAYRGVGIHDFQPAQRIEEVVKPEIDRVYGMSTAQALVAYVTDPTNPPEARLFAKARCVALWQLAAESREVRPSLSLSMLDAYTAGLDSQRWLDPNFYGTLLEHPGVPGSRTRLQRELPLTDEQRGR